MAELESLETAAEHERILREIESTDTACIGPTLRCVPRPEPRGDRRGHRRGDRASCASELRGSGCRGCGGRLGVLAGRAVPGGPGDAARALCQPGSLGGSPPAVAPRSPGAARAPLFSVPPLPPGTARLHPRGSPLPCSVTSFPSPRSRRSFGHCCFRGAQGCDNLKAASDEESPHSLANVIILAQLSASMPCSVSLDRVSIAARRC